MVSSFRLARLLMLLSVALAGGVVTSDAAGQGYRVGQGDVIRVTVWSQPTLGGQFTVDGAGGITLPLIGAVKAEGLAIEDIEREITQRLAAGYLNNPQVSVAVAEFKSQRIFVVGEVRSPGAVPLTGSLTLVEALTRVGSLTEFAGGELVVIRPAAGTRLSGPVLPSATGAQEMLRVDVKTLQAKGPTTNVDLLDGDTVVVPRAEVVYVIGQINSPGAYTYDKDMTILQVISRANGVNEVGTTRRLKILRIVDGKRTELKASLSDKVRPGDTVVVSSRWF